MSSKKHRRLRTAAEIAGQPPDLIFNFLGGPSKPRAEESFNRVATAVSGGIRMTRDPSTLPSSGRDVTALLLRAETFEHVIRNWMLLAEFVPKVFLIPQIRTQWLGGAPE